MADYHYVYVYGPDGHENNRVASEVARQAKLRGCELKGPAKLKRAGEDVLNTVAWGEDPADKFHNWLLHLPMEDLLRFEEIGAYKIRLQDQGVLRGIIEDGIPTDTDACVLVRTRQAVHSNTSTPFSYDPAQDYYTEPGEVK